MPDQSTAKQRLADPPRHPRPSRCFDVSHVSCCLSPPPFGFGRFGSWRFYQVPQHGTTSQSVKTNPFGATAQNPVRPPESPFFASKTAKSLPGRPRRATVGPVPQIGFVFSLRAGGTVQRGKAGASTGVGQLLAPAFTIFPRPPPRSGIITSRA